jgi:type VI secretion system protein VasI
MHKFLAAFALLFVCATAQAELSDCSKAITDEEFASCVDAKIGDIGVPRAKPPSPPPVSKPAKPAPESLPPPTGPGKWSIRTETSKVDDSQNVYLYLDSEDVIVGDHRGSTRPRLWVRCRENRTGAILDWDPFWFHSEHSVVTRVDKARAQKQEWSSSTDHVAVFHPQSIAFIKTLARGNQLFVQVAPINEPLHGATFDLRGLRYYLPTLQKACHWQ